jgi:hypothetical protein
VSYLVHYQFYTFVPPVHKIQPNLIGKIRSTLFILGLKEWNMDSAMTNNIWQPLKSAGQWLKFFDSMYAMLICVVLLLVGTYAANGAHVPHTTMEAVIWVSAILSILLFVRAYANKGLALLCWTQIFLGQIFACLFLSVLSGAVPHPILTYLTGIVVAYAVGALCLWFLDRSARLNLMDNLGYMYEYPMLGNVFFIACLAMMVFPITPSFIGEEILVSAIHMEHAALVGLFALGYVLSGICVMRLFAKLFFGPHKKTYHEIAYRSS